MTAVLIADDEPVSRRLLQATLQRCCPDLRHRRASSARPC
jgi:CheY-like chemotaxis protein